MKKRVAAAVMAAMLCLSLAGCKKAKKKKCENFDLAEAATLMGAENYTKLENLVTTLEYQYDAISKGAKGDSTAVYNTLAGDQINEFLKVYPTSSGFKYLNVEDLQSFTYYFSFRKGEPNCMMNFAATAYVFKTEEAAKAFFEAYEPDSETTIKYFDMLGSDGSKEFGKTKTRDDGLMYRCYAVGGDDFGIRFEEGTYLLGNTVIDMTEAIGLYKNPDKQLNDVCDLLGIPRVEDVL